MKAGQQTSLQAGVTLIELAIAVAVIAILIAIGNSSYRNHVLRVKSADAPRELLMLAVRLQGCHKRTGSYARRDDVPNACVTLPYATPEGDYQISGDIGADTFRLRATPIGGQAADERCAAFTLDHLGQQGVTGTASAEPQGCWGGRGS
jgi:type IV pilus assembly protein PilE